MLFDGDEERELARELETQSQRVPEKQRASAVASQPLSSALFSCRFPTQRPSLAGILIFCLSFSCPLCVLSSGRLLARNHITPSGQSVGVFADTAEENSDARRAKRRTAHGARHAQEGGEQASCGLSSPAASPSPSSFQISPEVLLSEIRLRTPPATKKARCCGHV